MAASEYDRETKDRDSVLAQQFDTGTFLHNLGNILKGFKYDYETKKYISVEDDGYLNPVGAKQILNEIEGRIQNVNASANLRRDEIAHMRQDVWFSLCKKLLVNNVKYGLDATNIKTVLHIVDHNLLTFLSRAEDFGFFKKLSGFFQRKETVSQTYSMQPEQAESRRFSI